MRKKTYDMPIIAATESVLKFASLWDHAAKRSLITDRQQIEDPLADAAVWLGGDVDSDGAAAPDLELLFQTAGLSDYIADQKILRDWLAQIVRFRKLSVCDRESLLEGIKAWAVKAQTTSTLEIRHGRFCREYRTHFDSVQALVGEVLIHLPQLQKGAGLQLMQGDILQCSECKTFYVISRSDDSGVCSPRCRAARARSR